MTPQTQILDDPLFDGYDLGDFLPITQHFVPSDEGYENDTDLESESEVAPLFTQDSKGLDRFERPPSLFTCLKIHQDDELGFLPMEGKATATASLSHSTESFCDLPVYIEHTSNAEDIQSLKRFDKKLFNLVEFLVHAAKETTIKDITSHSSWVNLPFKQPLRHSNTVVICQIFQRAIPESSRVILGQAEITSDHLLSLPLVDESCKSTVGVYINCAVGIPSGHRKNQESDLPTSFEECQIMTPIANIPESTESDHIAIYAGSSTADLEDRPSLPDLGLAFADSGWLIRLLEMVVIMLLDAYLPPDPDSFRTRYGIGKEEYFNALDSCGIHRSKFRPLNKAFPTKQS
ncbi:hypothetical protein N7451_011866 [Penicillium sp. IBT 35674x]|nr:hypothetical protein N7451_011866 [Penicillium sp. IBT 35674x]